MQQSRELLGELRSELSDSRLARISLYNQQFRELRSKSSDSRLRESVCTI